MKKINLKGISEILSEKEMKNVTGGDFLMKDRIVDDGCSDSLCTSNSDCCPRHPNCTPIPNWAGKKACSV